MSGMEAVRPYFTKLLWTTNIAQGDKHGLLMTTLLFFGVMLVRGLIQYLNTYLTQWIGQRTIFDLRMEVFEHLQRRGLKFFDKNPIGRLITRVTNDIEVLNDMFSSGIVMVFSDVFTISRDSLLHVLDELAACSDIAERVAAALLRDVSLPEERHARRTAKSACQIARINTFMQEHITGMMVDQVFNREEKFIQTVR